MGKAIRKKAIAFSFHPPFLHSILPPDVGEENNRDKITKNARGLGI